MRIYGYARVSTKDQNLDIQVEKIQEYCKHREFELVQIYSEKVSGKSRDGRAELEDMLGVLKNNPLSIGAVVVYKLDRLGRSISDLINIVKLLETHKIQFISITDNIDTTTPQGRLFFHLMGAVAEFERELIQERTQLGILKARQSGKKFGRRKIVVDMNDVRTKIAAGIPKRRICSDLKVSRSFLNKRLSDERKKGV